MTDKFDLLCLFAEASLRSSEGPHVLLPSARPVRVCPMQKLKELYVMKTVFCVEGLDQQLPEPRAIAVLVSCAGCRIALIRRRGRLI